MRSVSLLIGLLLLGISGFAAVQQKQQQGGGATLTRESVEKLLEVLSFECRSEMESALAQQSEISMNCKLEIQQAIQEYSIPIQQAPQESTAELTEEDDDLSDESEQKVNKESVQNDAKLKVKKEGGISPIYSIIAFVIVFFGGIAAYVAVVIQTKGTLPAVKPKKLSKKKEEKLKMKKEKMNQL